MPARASRSPRALPRAFSRAMIWLALGLAAAALSGCLDLTEPQAPGPATNTQAAAGTTTPNRSPASADVDTTGGRRPAGVSAGAQPARIARHVDGDTVWVEPLAYDGDIRLPLPADATSRIRVLLIDTPETVHPTRDVECGGPEASAATATLLPEGSLVWVLADVTDRDRYDRPLRYLFTADGVDLGDHLLTAGLARVAHYPPDDRFLDRYRTIEADARARGVGIWGELCPAP
jgi:micrococcal nuclease